MKTKEELDALKEEVEALKGKLAELSEEELAQVSGGTAPSDPDGEALVEEIQGLAGDPAVLEKRLKKWQTQGLLYGVADAPSNDSFADNEAISRRPPDNDNTNACERISQNRQTGMKINSSSDNSSGYQISERMRVQIGSLDQANFNAQNGQNMTKVAEGAVNSTVELLRTLKEKAIHSVNNVSTEVDRAEIQKEIEASFSEIDDNAFLTDQSGNQRAHLDMTDMRAGAPVQPGTRVPRDVAIRVADRGSSGGQVRTGTEGVKPIDNALQRALNQEADEENK